MKTPRLDATGVFIPVAIWEHSELSWLEKCLYAEIHALGGHQGKCGASNESLSEIMGMTPGSVMVAISKFRKLNLAEDVTGKCKRNLKTHWEPLVMAKDALVMANSGLVMAKPPIRDNKEGKGTQRVAFEFQESLKTPEFLKAWRDWEQHRRETKKPLTPMAIKKQSDMLATIGPVRATAAINYSIANGYQGIFEPRNGNNIQATKPIPPPRPPGGDF